MKPKLYVREISDEERRKLEAGLRSSNAFQLRRCQIIMASARGVPVSAIAEQIGCNRDTPRKVINAFNEKGLGVLEQGSRRPHRIERAFDAEKEKRLKELIRQKPRNYNKDSSLWTLKLLAEVSFEQGITEKEVSQDAVHQALKRLGIRWKQAKHWLTSTDSQYKMKKNDEIDG